ncbi:fused response regulator/phosphatase [bacterium]|nr:fused response regulator/phosphatase [bacterium]
MEINREPEKPTVLVVDDEEEALRAIGTLLARKGGYNVLSSASGEEAIRLLAENEIDLVITDLRMPGVDGLELLKHISREYPTIFVIISTAFGSLDSAVDALRRGAVDYLQKPNKPSEMLAKVAEVLERRSKLLKEKAEFAAVRKMAESQTSDLQRAGAIQQRWIPEGYEGCGIKVITRFHSAEALSGDFLDLVELGKDRLGIVVGDVVGHGLAASLQMGIVQRLIRKDLIDGSQTNSIFTYLNNFLFDEYHMDSVFTAFVAIFDGKEYSLNYSIGGHPPPIKIHADGKLEYIETSCPGLLMIPDYRFIEHKTSIEPGEKLVIYTDGLVEARNPSGDLFGEERLEKILKSESGKSLETFVGAIEAGLTEFRENAPVLDDISLIVAEIV